MSERACPTPGDHGVCDDGTFRTGDVVLAAVRNPFENPNSKGKYRPFVLVRRRGGHWCGMGLTTKPRYANGVPRVAIPDPLAVGLQRQGFLWGDRLTNVCVLDLRNVLGVVDTALAEALISLVSLGAADAAALREAAQPSSRASSAA